MLCQLFFGLNKVNLLETIITKSHFGIIRRGQTLPDLRALELDRAILDFLLHAYKVAYPRSRASAGHLFCCSNLKFQTNSKDNGTDDGRRNGPGQTTFDRVAVGKFLVGFPAFRRGGANQAPDSKKQYKRANNA